MASRGVVWLLALCGIVEAYPSYLVCNDPRFEGRDTIMGLTVKAGLSTKLQPFASSYKAGVPVDFGFVDLEPGMMMAFRALPTYGYLGQYGRFSKLSSAVTPTGDCPNTAISLKPTSFESLTWTPTSDTYGPVKFSLLYGNNMQLYIVEVTLSGPPVPNVEPVWRSASSSASNSNSGNDGQLLSQTVSAEAGSPGACEAPTDGSYNLPNSPVFLQKLRGKSITFPAGQCLPCREDFLENCSSALVECPEGPGLPASQRLFTSDNCTGTSVVSQLPTSFVHCPGPEYYGVDNLDLSRFVQKLQRDYPLYFPNASVAEEAIFEYRRMLKVIQKFPDAPAVPSKLVDLVWHEHILDTQVYRRDSQRLFGRYMHHAPSFGDNEDEAVMEEKKEMVAQQQEMLQLYAKLFGDEPRAQFWPQAQASASPQMGEGRLPDCCKAKCVKVNCVTCVGCNAVKCGKLFSSDSSDGKTTKKLQHVLPDHFAGYVPFLSKFSRDAEDIPGFLCTQSPMTGMYVDWTISGGYIYFQQVMKAKAWHAVGLTATAPYNMGFADYIVAIFEGNYTGVRDGYKYDVGNHYPCWDFLTQCSANVPGTPGTTDPFDGNVFQLDGSSVSTWTRLLVTPDTEKDVPITNADQHVLFAYGHDHNFTYHGKSGHATVLLNFFTGTMSAVA